MPKPFQIWITQSGLLVIRSFHCRITGPRIITQSATVIRCPVAAPRGQRKAAAVNAISCNGNVQYEPSIIRTVGSNELVNVRLPHRSWGVGSVHLLGPNSTSAV